MKNSFICLVIVIILVLTSCGKDNSNIDKKPVENNINTGYSINSVTKNPISTADPSAGQKDIFNQIEELMKNYETGLIKAINNNDFNLVKPYLLMDSPIYKAQNELISDLNSKGVKEKLVSYDIIRTNYEGENVYKVLVVESIFIDYPQKEDVTKEFHWIYTVKQIDDNIKLSSIEEWKDFDKFIDNAQGNVKVDGYYASEFMYDEYDNLLIEKLNGNNPKELDQAFDSKDIREKHELMIKYLRGKGHDFSVINSEILEEPSNQSIINQMTKKITLSYIDIDSDKKEFDLILTFKLEEHRTGFQGLFGGYVTINEINFKE